MPVSCQKEQMSLTHKTPIVHERGIEHSFNRLLENIRWDLLCQNSLALSNFYKKINFKNHEYKDDGQKMYPLTFQSKLFLFTPFLHIFESAWEELTQMVHACSYHFPRRAQCHVHDTSKTCVQCTYWDCFECILNFL